MSAIFSAPYAADDETIARHLLSNAALTPAREARIDDESRALVGAIRSAAAGIGGIEALLREYSLSTPEGLALMVLAEALLRVPDDETADRLISDKLGQGDFASGAHQGENLLVSASAWALGVSARLIGPRDTPENVLRGVVRRLGLPTVRGAMRQAMRIMGSHFVLGQTINDALKRAGSGRGRLFRYSFDMLGEGARTDADAKSYLASYHAAIAAIGKVAGNDALPDRPGISVKLSALHARYEAVSHTRVMSELVPRVTELARAAAKYDLNFTVDAEEADRLELSLDVIAAVASDADLADWQGFGLAIQSYGKRAAAVIDYTVELSKSLNRRFMVRLVKGAYWDTEIKRAQERGLADYPVFTRKAMTDLNFLDCAQKMLDARVQIFPQFATHNALTVASILERAGDTEGYEFQRLHGMGDALYDCLLTRHKGVGVRTYAPVGQHQDLLAYLVRRLLENGANSSFVSIAADANVPVEELLRRPQDTIVKPVRARNTHIKLPSELFGARRNSPGVEFGDRAALAAMIAKIPSTSEQLATRTPITAADPTKIMQAAHAGFVAWDSTPASHRADILERAADILQARQGEMLGMLADEAGKTLDDGVAEWREAIDFLRYYAASARNALAQEEKLPGPVGEENIRRYRGRGVFLCISPWNFPLAIFTGQIAAALVAGNAVVAKPAEQTPIIAAAMVAIFHEAGVPASALHLAQGDGAIGAALVAHPRVAGVAFTGSTETAFAINRSLASKNAPIVPLIAETGGINAMLVDATALPEQVVDDAAMSAFRSAGQRCSALRLLVVQEEVADKIIEMLAGAAKELKLGEPRDPATHIGPVIDREAQKMLHDHITTMRAGAKTHYAGVAPQGCYVAPHIFEIKDITDLTKEVFGPILHVVRYAARDRELVLEKIAGLGYGLTLGIHTRIDGAAEEIAAKLMVGNVYVNRNMIGAVVGVQPFGGAGLSGTGPKAGGPDYVKRFAMEQVVSTNTAAAGGNAALLAAEE